MSDPELPFVMRDVRAVDVRTTARDAVSPSARFGVIDVGSNSIRLVVFDTLGLVPAPVFNERTMCGLGAGLRETRRLGDAPIAAATECLARYTLIARELGATELEILATAAVREAENGEEFVASIRTRFKVSVRVLTGEDEARLAALGVIGGFSDVDGFVGDLGGGSLELTEIADGRPGRSTSMPLGPLRLGELSSRSRRRVASAVDLHLNNVSWIGDLRGRTLYPVGGAWRTIARAHMARTGYPLEVIHGYVIDASEAISFLGELSTMSSKQARALPGVSKRRADTVAITGHVLKRVVEIGKPSRLVFSAYGVREGSIFERMATVVPLRDPLLESCAAIAAEAGRAAVEPGTIADWVLPFLGAIGEPERRLVQAACLLSDIAWAEHPSYRGEHAYLRVLRMPIAGLDHADRVFLATAVLARYTGGTSAAAAAPVAKLLSPERTALATRLGVALRLALTLCGGAGQLLDGIATERSGAVVRVHVPRSLMPLFGEVAGRRISAAEAACDLKVVINPLY